MINLPVIHKTHRRPTVRCIRARVRVLAVSVALLAAAVAAPSVRAQSSAQSPSPAPPSTTAAMVGSVPAGSLARAQRISLFNDANRLFREGLDKAKSDQPAAATLFRSAAAAWRTIARDGDIHNAQLECNIGNAELLGGDVPRAIAAFRRARAIDPLNPQVRDGLAAARRAAGTESLAPGAVPTAPADQPQGGVRGSLRAIGSMLGYAAHRTLLYLPERLLLWTAAIGYLGAFLLMGARIWFRRTLPFWAPVALLLLAALAAGPLIARELNTTPEGVVIEPHMVGRHGPAELYEPAFKEPLTPGLEVRIEDQRAGWLMIRLSDGREAWVPARGVEPI